MKKATSELEKAKQTKERALRNRNKRKYKRNKKGSKQLRKTFDHSFVHGKNYEQQQQQPRSSSSPRVPPATATAMYDGHSSTVPSFVRVRHAQNVWIKTYQNVVKWQYQHQLNYWKNCTVRLRAENARLRRRLAVQDSEDEEEEAQQRQRQAAAAEKDTAEALLDEEFIAFMEVSARHRLERSRLKNESVH
ncbi:uncharacterized protein LOC128743755 [Sabethes cyaneus]|uniref:uncharacterized protein LOC128743755 n=1 Tax=Sabethes cyaneus TaxID=53552 RepID=UPI00237E7116|nr:uncharacterized protein LOC128743755 [Sabethes cyaneus]